MPFPDQFVPKKPPPGWKTVVSGRAPNGKSIFSALFGRQFIVEADGRCAPCDGELTLADEPVYHQGVTYPGKYRPSLVRRDVDLWAWRSFTDLVVQGSVRSDEPRDSMLVKLECRGPSTVIQQEILVTGDRVVERGPLGLRLTDPVPFTEMPIRYDKAYGGTDEKAEIKLVDPDELRFYELHLSADENLEMGLLCYPRNPAGKGYLVDEDGAVGLAWPNLELPGDRLALSGLLSPHERWGSRPYPACFDWFSQAWFPRCAFFGDFEPTHDGRVPEAEVQLGILDAGLTDLPLLRRPKHGFAQGAHPLLCRRRLVGDEALRVTAMSRDGRDFGVRLPGLAPKVKLFALDCKGTKLDASLDLVLVDTEASRLTLLWRATWMTEVEHPPLDWMTDARYEVLWG